MSDFSLTAPQALAGLDPNVFSAMPGRDYGEVAVTAWLEAQHAALDMDDIEASRVIVQERLRKGRDWLKGRDKRTTEYRKAHGLFNELEDRHRGILIQYRCAAYACWMHCCEVYAALCHVERATWIAANARNRFSAETPQGIWAAVRPNQPPPGAWPQQEHELWIERRIEYLEVWNRDELEFLLHERMLAR